MADQKRWFKVWVAITNDPAFLSLPLDALGRWTLLGAWMAEHGDKGTLRASETAIRHVLRLRENDNAISVLNALPNVTVNRGENDNDEFTVIISKWSKYQEDSTIYERLKRHRAKANDNGVRREEKRRESPISPHSTKDNQIEADTLALLNSLAGTIWKPGKAYGGGLRSRIAEGATPEDLAAVVRLKVSRWLKDDKMRAYLTPKTLFGKENFERYVAEIRMPVLPGSDPYAKLPRYVTCDRCHETYQSGNGFPPHACSLRAGTA